MPDNLITISITDLEAGNLINGLQWLSKVLCYIDLCMPTNRFNQKRGLLAGQIETLQCLAKYIESRKAEVPFEENEIEVLELVPGIDSIRAKIKSARLKLHPRTILRKQAIPAC
jgi:hypothetical protein